ncbi:hypothetical protein ACOSQ2_023438 [Xanthoceras sorbifolium]
MVADRSYRMGKLLEVMEESLSDMHNKFVGPISVTPAIPLMEGKGSDVRVGLARKIGDVVEVVVDVEFNYDDKLDLK